MLRFSHPISKRLSIPLIESTSLLVGARNQQLSCQELPSNLFPTCTAYLVLLYESANKGYVLLAICPASLDTEASQQI